MHIIPGRGLDNIIFGMTQEQAEKVCGKPEKIAYDNYSDGDKTAALYYRKLGFSLHFDSFHDWRLSTIEITNSQAQLMGSSFINILENEAQSILTSLGVTWIEEENGCRYFEEWNLNFWIEDNIVTSIQWEAFYDDEGNYIWPDDKI